MYENPEAEPVPHVFLILDNSRPGLPPIKIRVGDKYGNGTGTELTPDQALQLAAALTDWAALPHRFGRPV